MKSGEPGVPEMGEWIAQNMKMGDVVGVDSLSHVRVTSSGLEKVFGSKGRILKAIKENPVDKVWSMESPKQPDMPQGPVKVHVKNGCSHRENLQPFRILSRRRVLRLTLLQCLTRFVGSLIFGVMMWNVTRCATPTLL